MINTLRRAAALWASLAAILFAAATPAFSQAPTDAQRSAIRSAMPRGLPGPLRQHPAGRHGVAAMPAAKHVEPVVGLPGRGARGGSPGRRPRPKPRPEPKRPNAKAESAPAAATAKPAADGSRTADRRAPKAARHHGQKAEQRADRGDPQRVPLRLSKELCRRADRRCGGVEMSGKEQSEALGGLPESGQCRQRRRCNACGRQRCAAAARARPAAAARRCAGARAGAAADAAARGAFRLEIGMRRGRSRAMRRTFSRRRPYHAMPGAQAASLSPACADSLGRSPRDNCEETATADIEIRRFRGDRGLRLPITEYCRSGGNRAYRRDRRRPRRPLFRLSLEKAPSGRAISTCSNRTPPAPPGALAWCSPNRRWNSCAPTILTRSTPSRRGWRAGRTSR